MSADAQGTDDVEAFYARGLELGRLAGGDGALEYLRTQALIKRYLPAPPADVLDVGGGPGRYAIWLAECGYRAHLVDLVPLHVEQARAASLARPESALATAGIGDARALAFRDESMDAVLLLGPLYHLQVREDRVRALAEAGRICRPGGVVFVAGISRFASALDGLRGGHLNDPTFAGIVDEDLHHGRHQNPSGHPAYFTTAYFHRPEDLATEVAAAGLIHETTVAVEGPAWLLPDLASWLADEQRKAVLLATIERLEGEPALLGVSAHLLTIARRPPK